ncbi:molybdenum cofactor guanylyltransferase [Melaminivora sp.]
MPDPIARQDITAVILAGGRSRRMGGLDKGLQLFHGLPLALHAARRVQPQVGAVMLNANRHLAQYQRWGWPVWPDIEPEQPGPLAGFMTGLAHCPTPWLLALPCDTPLFPPDLAQRLAQAASQAAAPWPWQRPRSRPPLRIQSRHRTCPACRPSPALARPRRVLPAAPQLAAVADAICARRWPARTTMEPAAGLCPGAFRPARR